MSRSGRLRVGLGSILVAAMATSSRADLVSNGGFETGDFTAWAVTPAVAGSDLSVTAAGHTGSFAAYFSADDFKQDVIAQVLATTAGASYQIDFWVYNAGVGDDRLQVVWEGATVLNLNPVSTPLESWSQIIIPVIATANGSELRIGGYDVAGYFGVDDVRVELSAVPEPTAVALLGLGVLGLVAGSRRRPRR